MELHERFKHVHRFPGPGDDMHPREYYLKKLVSSLYTVGRVSNTPSPIPLPDFDDIADLENIVDALDTLKQDIQDTINHHLS